MPRTAPGTLLPTFLPTPGASPPGISRQPWSSPASPRRSGDTCPGPASGAQGQSLLCRPCWSLAPLTLFTPDQFPRRLSISTARCFLPLARLWRHPWALCCQIRAPASPSPTSSGSLTLSLPGVCPGVFDGCRGPSSLPTALGGPRSPHRQSPSQPSFFAIKSLLPQSWRGDWAVLLGQSQESGFAGVQFLYSHLMFFSVSGSLPTAMKASPSLKKSDTPDFRPLRLNSFPHTVTLPPGSPGL